MNERRIINLDKYQYSGLLRQLIELAMNGSMQDIDEIMAFLNPQSKLATTRFVDFSLSLVNTKEGKKRIEFYLFHGSQCQRNYASLYFNRLDEWETVKKAFDLGLIDEIQAFSR